MTIKYGTKCIGLRWSLLASGLSMSFDILEYSNESCDVKRKERDS